ncbi:MAG: hypothetical protein JEZ05_05090 [Tenericutes bacterium]|nr:hypothetical protein [Mycoplasmatota bacterium]
MIKKVETKKDLKKFIFYVKELYKDNPHYIYPLFFVLLKELRKEVLKNNNYTALLSIDDLGKIQGRLLYRFEKNVKENREVAYFSYFDAINSKEVTKELFSYMEDDMKKLNISHSEGSFTPYDPDNRRGVLINSFDKDPVIFTTYNMYYIPALLEDYGYSKKTDTYCVITEDTENNQKRLNTLGNFFERRYKIDVDYINFKNIDKEIEDIHRILNEADNEHIYQEVPSIELIRSVADSMRLFLDKRIIRIARERETGRPIGFCFCLLDFNQVFKKLKGKVRPIRMLLLKRKITKVRGMMQYVIPKYQGTGMIGYIYKKIFDEFQIMGIKEFEAGTMMEGNDKPLASFNKFGGKISKTYRIYGKER